MVEEAPSTRRRAVLERLSLRGSRRAAAIVAAVVLFYAGLAILAVAAAFDDGAVQVASDDGMDLTTSGSESFDAPVAGGPAPPESEPAGTGGIEEDVATAERVPTAGVSDEGTGRPESPARQTTPRVARGPGITDEEIKIGFYVVRPLNYSTFGGSGDSADDRAAVEAVVEEINATGIVGRSIVPVFREIDPATNPSWTTDAQAACTYFTEDEEVFAAFTIASGTTDGAVSCYAQHGTPVFNHIRYSYTPAELEQYAGHSYLLGRSLDPRRWGAALVDGLQTAGFFGDNTRLGVIRYDSPPFDYLTNKVIRPRLAKAGIEIVEEVAVGQPDSAVGLGTMSSQLGNAVLRFRAAGIDRLVFVEAGGAVTFLFMNEAESQGYRPRYGLHSLNVPEFQADDQAPVEQLAGSMGVGWVPGDDVDEAQYPPGLPAVERCLAIFDAGGVSTGVSAASPLGYCDGLFLLKEALERAPELSAAGLRAGVEALGDDHQSAVTFVARFGPGRYDAPAAYRIFAFDQECDCYLYTTGSQPFP